MIWYNDTMTAIDEARERGDLVVRPNGHAVDAATYDSRHHAFVLSTRRGDFVRFTWKGKRRYLKVDTMTGFGVFGWDPETGKYWRCEFEYVDAIIRPQDNAYAFMKHPKKFPQESEAQASA